LGGTSIFQATFASAGLAEGARFELAVHGVDAGFQDRWFQPLTHPSLREKEEKEIRVAIRTLLNFRISIRIGGYKPGML
jgi:hypothetical protein